MAEMMRNPFAFVWTKGRNRWAYYRTVVPRQRRLRRAVERTRPVAVAEANTEAKAQAGERGVRILCGRSRLWDAIAALKSLYRFGAFSGVPLTFHDDGTLRPRHAAVLRRHLPGVRIVWRGEADRAVRPVLAGRGLQHCMALREARPPFFLKLFDFPHFAGGMPYVQVDSDVLFFREPTALADALRTPPDAWRDRFNEDRIDAYAWTIDEVREATGVMLVPRINMGVAALRRDAASFERYEQYLTVPLADPKRRYYQEQTLTAIEASRLGTAYLPPTYDVAGRWSTDAVGVVSEHYCGEMRLKFYDHFCERVAPELE